MKNLPEENVSGTTPAPMSDALFNRLLTAMVQASDEADGEQEEKEIQEMESVLRKLSPAPLPAHVAMKLGVQMQLAQVMKRKNYWLRSGVAAAAALVLFAAGGAISVSGNAVADGEKETLVGRSIIDTRRAKEMIWKDEHSPVRKFEVIYEDSFMLEDEGTTTLIRVPNTAEVEVEEECL